MGYEGKDEYGDNTYRLGDLVLSDRFPCMTNYSFGGYLAHSGRRVSYIPCQEVHITDGDNNTLARVAVRTDEEALAVIEANRGNWLNGFLQT